MEIILTNKKLLFKFMIQLFKIIKKMDELHLKYLIINLFNLKSTAHLKLTDSLGFKKLLY